MFSLSPIKQKQYLSSSNQFEQPLDDMSCIIDNGSVGSLYLGNIESASSLENLKKHKIKGVLSICMNKIPFEVQTSLSNYLHIYLEDCESENIARHFENSNQFIDKARQSGNVLVHCMAGISRSASLVAAYLMKKNNMSAQDAIRLLERKRWQVYPNNGFLRQLQQYQKILLQQNGRSDISSPLRDSQSSKFQTPIKGSLFYSKYEELQQSSSIKTRPLDEICFDNYKRKSIGFDDLLKSPEPKEKKPFSLTQHRPNSAIRTSPDLMKKQHLLADAIHGNKKDGLAALAQELNSIDWQTKKLDIESKYLKPSSQQNNVKSFLTQTRPSQLNQHQSKLDQLLNSFNRKSVL